MAYFNEFPYTRNYDSDLGWLIKHVKKLLECCDDATDKLKILMQFYDDVNSGNFPDAVVNAFKTWMRDNLVNLVGDLVKGVYFGLTPDGYFVAYIPEHWDDIIFNTTGYDLQLAGYNFGHLVLSY